MSMDKEQILAAARNNKSRGQEYENREYMRGSLLSVFVTLLVGSCLFLLELIVNKSINVGLIALAMTTAAVDSLYEGIKLKRRHMTVVGILLSLGAILAILLFIVQVVLV